MKLPEVPAKGPRRWRELATAAVAYMRATTPVAGDGVSVRELPGGIQLNARTGRAVGSAVALHPFKLVNVSDESGLKIRVVYGEVSSNKPSGHSLGDVPPFILPVVGAEGKVYVSVTVDNTGGISSVTCGIVDSEILPGDDPVFPFSIGSYSVEGSSLNIAQAIIGSLFFELCGGSQPIWRGV